MKIDWKTKLTSRKFWLALAAFIVGVAKAFESGAPWSTQLGGLVMSAGAVVGYLIAEGLVDKSRNNTQDPP